MQYTLQRFRRIIHIHQGVNQERHKLVEPLTPLGLQSLHGAAVAQAGQALIAAIRILKPALLQPAQGSGFIHFRQPQLVAAIVYTPLIGIILIFRGNDIRKMTSHPASVFIQRRQAVFPAIEAHNPRNPSAGQRILRQNLSLFVFHTLKGMFQIAKEHIGAPQLTDHPGRKQLQFLQLLQDL